MSNYSVVKYSNESFDLWDTFVKTSVNGNIYHTRRFLSYHDKNKFEDCSILIYKNERIRNVSNFTDNKKKISKLVIRFFAGYLSICK
jgi:hypothetical protein